VALYDRALPDAAVAAHYAARTSLPLLGSGVVAYRRALNPTLTARGGNLQIANTVIPVLQNGLAPRLDLDGIVASATAMVTPGQTIHARVQEGPGNARDWMGLYTAGADDGSPLAMVYLLGTTNPPSSGFTTATVPFTLPTTPGPYEVRFFWSDGYTKLATSGVVIVGGPTVSLTSPASGTTFNAGETVTLTASVGDYGAGVVRVDFYADGHLVNPITSPPWMTGWGVW
jgi:hypothetical protein